MSFQKGNKNINIEKVKLPLVSNNEYRSGETKKKQKKELMVYENIRRGSSPNAGRYVHVLHRFHTSITNYSSNIANDSA